MTAIVLPPEVERRLANEASKRGTTLEVLAIEYLREQLARPRPGAGAGNGDNLFDFLSGYIGTVDGTTEALSEGSGQRFVEGLVEKQRRGRA